MTVVEALPGGGWYSKLLLPHLGADGQLIGVNYPQCRMGRCLASSARSALPSWLPGPQTGQQALKNGAAKTLHPSQLLNLARAPEDLSGTADAVLLLIRALHNLARFEDQGGFLTTAIADSYNVLKPGGIVGVVQHHAPDSCKRRVG